ncbi:hypothetical protein GCM10023190_19550 [Enteractinococcus fodinae]
MQRRLRTMSTHPEDPRVFSQSKILLMFGLPLSVLSTLIMPMFISDYLASSDRDLFAFFLPVLLLVVSYSFVLHAFFRRFGVDRDKVWTRFGKVFYRQVRFVEIERLDVGVNRFKLYAHGTKVNIDYNRFDYSLVYIRLLEELQYRRFKLQKVEINDPDWEVAAQTHRHMLATKVYQSHQAFYDANPAEFARLEALMQPPKTYVK